MTTDAAVTAPGAEPSVAEGSAPPVEVFPYRPTLRSGLRDAWRCRDLAFGIASQFLTFRRPNMILGIWWVPIRIVFSTVALAFVFGGVLGVSSAPGVPYFLFITVGAMGWWIFDRGTRYTMMSFQRFRRYVTNLSFPLIVVPFAGMVALTIPIGFIAVFLAAVLIGFSVIDSQLYINLPEAVYLVPVSLAWLVLAAVIIGLLTGPIYWRVRDVRILFRLLLPFWMFVTPVIYPVETLSGALRTGVLANPLTPPVLMFKEGLLGTAGPPLWSLVSAAGTTAVALLLGLWFTNRYGRSIISREPEEGDDDEFA